MTETGASGRALLIAILLAVVWLGAAGFALAHDLVWPIAPRALVELAALLLAPVAAIFAIAAAIIARSTTVAAIPETPEGIAEADLSGTLVRLAALREGLAADAGQLVDHGARLADQAEASRAVADEMAAAAARIGEASAALAATFATTSGDIQQWQQALASSHAQVHGETEALRAATDNLAEGLRGAAAGGREASAALASELERLATLATDGRTRSEAGIKTIRAEADQLFDLLENGLSARRDSLRHAGEDLAQQLDDGWKRFESAAGAATTRLHQHLDQLDGQSAGLETRLAAQIATSEQLALSSERSFQLLDARLQHSGQSMDATLDRLAGRVQQLNTELASLSAPLKDSESASKTLDSAVSGLRETVLQTIDILGQTLPEKALDTARTADTLRAEIATLVTAVDQLHDRANALATPLGDSEAAITAASATFATQRTAMETAGEALVVELNQARTLIAEVEDQTRDTSLAAATRLVEALTRVREVATQATGTMREMLDGLLDEARASLSDAAGDALRASFVTPIAEQTRAAETAAATAAERTAQSLAALAQSLKLVDDHAQTRLATLEAGRQAELMAASALLRERLDAAGPALLAALDKPMTDADWEQWRKGERGLFNRRAISLLTARESREIRALLDADPALKTTAQRYSGDFVALTARLPALASALQSSEQGRIAAALHEALDG